MSYQYTTALSHIVLAGTGIYCIASYRQLLNDGRSNLPCATFGIIITNSLLGTWRWGNPDYGDKVEKPYNFGFFLQNIFALPCIAGQIWLINDYERIIGYLHPMLSCIPLAAYLGDQSRTNIIVDVLVGLNIVSCAGVSYQAENYYGIATAVAFVLNHFYIARKDEISGVPGRDLYNYALCFFTYFAYKAVTAI